MFLLFYVLVSPCYGAVPFSQVLVQANAGIAKAQVAVGDAYAKGNGVPQDYKKAFTWYQKAADQGYAQGQRPLGALYELGYGVDKNMVKAAALYEKAALQGVARAQVNLGVLYENGQGVAKDLRKAFMWYTKAADQGYGRGMNQLAMLYESGLGVEKDVNQAILLYKKGATAKYSKAMLNLGRIFRDGGEGVNKDIGVAVTWYQRAVDLGFLDAIAELDRAKALLMAQNQVLEVQGEGDNSVSQNLETVSGSQELLRVIPKPQPKLELSTKEPLKVVEVLPENKKVTVSPPTVVHTENAIPLGSDPQEKGDGFLMLIFVGSVVTLVLIFLFVLLQLRGKERFLGGSTSTIAALEDEIKGIRRQVEELGKIIQ